MSITDVTVTISVKKATSISGFGIPAIFVPGSANAYKEYNTIEAVELDYEATTFVNKFAQTFFAQQGHPQMLAVVTYQDLTTAYNMFTNKPWYIAILANEAVTTPHPQNDANVLSLSNLIEGSQYRMMFVQDSYGATDKITDANSLLGKIAGNTRTVLFVKKANGTETSAELLAATLVGLYGAKTIGSLNWHDLTAPTLTADDWDATSLVFIEQTGTVAFVNKSNNVAQTTSGKTVGGLYIDQVMGIDWVAQNIQSQLQDVLTNNDKVPFSTGGIALLQSVVENVLSKAYTNGIIDVDDASGNPLFSVTALDRADLDATDIANRTYKGLSYEYTPAGAIDTVNVYGEIEL